MKEINKRLSYEKCREMVSRCEIGKTAEEVRERCRIADAWLTANEVIDNEQYNELMMWIAYINRESYHRRDFR